MEVGAWDSELAAKCLKRSWRGERSVRPSLPAQIQIDLIEDLKTWVYFKRSRPKV